MCGGRVYISGGIDWDVVLNSVWCYSPEADCWSVKTSMLQPRADHCMEAFRGKLYVAGGWCEHAATGNRVILDTLDSFDPTTNQWETIATVPTPTYHCGMAVLNSSLYITGGLQHSGFNGASKKICVYDFKSGVWREKEYPVEIWEHLTCVLYTPVCEDLSLQPQAQPNRLSESSC